MQLAICSLSAQSVTKSTISTSGDTYTNGTVSLNWTLGELVVSDFNGANGEVGAGFHQSMLEDPSTSVSIVQLEEEVMLSPVPTYSFIRIITGHEGRLSYRLWDAQGRLWKKGSFEKGTSLDLSGIAPGTYWVELVTRDRRRGFYPVVRM